MAASRPDLQRGPGSRLRASALTLAAAALLVPGPAGAQEEARPHLSGRVELSGAPLPGATVVLHRVTPDTAGAVDSVRTTSQGTFGFDLPTVPDPGGRGEVYFASVRHDSITYFGRAIHQAVELDSTYVIEVSESETAPAGGAQLLVSMRHVILEEVEGGWRVTELLQVTNESDRTLVAREGDVTWSYPLAEGATQVEVGGEEVPPGEAAVGNGRYRVTAAIPPGERQFLVRYMVEAPELTLPAPGSIRQMELLVREPAPPLDVQGLAAVESVEMQPGTSFRRYVGMDLRDGRVVVAPGEEPGRFPVRWLAVVLGLILAGAGVWGVTRPRGAPAVAAAAGGGQAAPVGDRRGLLVEVARIDETLEGEALPEPEATALRQRRAELVERLRTLS